MLTDWLLGSGMNDLGNEVGVGTPGGHPRLPGFEQNRYAFWAVLLIGNMPERVPFVVVLFCCFVVTVQNFRR